MFSICGGSLSMFRCRCATIVSAFTGIVIIKAHIKNIHKDFIIFINDFKFITFMEKLKILNKKEIKAILALIKKQWGADFKQDYAFLMNTKNKIFIVNKDISRINLNRLRINNVGMYFGEINKGEIRLSIEGAQLVGPLAKKNVLELDEKEAREYLKGQDLDKGAKERGFVVIRHGEDFLGTGKSNGKVIYNYTPKERRILSND